MKKKTPTYNVTFDDIQGYIKKGYDNAIKDAAKYSIAIPMMVLRDEFGFGQKRLLDFYNAFIDLYDSVDKNYITINEVIDVIKEETGVEIIERNRR